MNFLVYKDDELNILYSVIDKFQMVFHPDVSPAGIIDHGKIASLKSADSDIIIVLDNNLVSPICEIGRKGFLTDADRMCKVAAVVTWAKTVGARISCGFSLFETDTQNLSLYPAELSRLQFLHAVDNIPAFIWKALAFGQIESIPECYLVKALNISERNYDYSETLQFLSAEAAIIKIVELLRENNMKPIDKFISFANWYADNFMIAECILFYAAATFANVQNVSMPKKFNSNIFEIVKKGIKNQAWDITYIINWNIVCSMKDDSECILFATDDITQKIIIMNTIPLGKIQYVLNAIFHTKNEKEKLSELFNTRFGSARIQPMFGLKEDEKVIRIKKIIFEEYSLLEKRCIDT